MYGKGLNSIRWRFALASAVLTLLGLLLRERWMGGGVPATGQQWLSLAVLAAGAAAITFWMASRLTGSIRALQRSTEAVAEGAFDSPVEVDCQCEVGGLADSFRKMTERLNANVLRMNALAYSDRITGLPNRAAIDHLLHHALAPERSEAFRAAIVFIDLDGFKRINDTLGHAGGDQLLALAAERILTLGLDRTHATLDVCTDAYGNPCDRLPQDIVFARFAGDEFVAVLPGQTDRAALRALADRVNQALQAPFSVNGQAVSVSASIGIAVTPDDTRSAAELLTFADLAMYSAKQAGRAGHMFFDQQIRDAIVGRAQTEADLRLALQRNELRLHYQPQWAAHSLAPTGVEALVRWQHPTRGLLVPAQFIDVAEQAGLMAALGRQVLQLALAQCRSWLDQGLHRPVAVNASPSEFAATGFVAGVLNAIQASGVPPRLVCIEITESIAMAEPEATAQRLQALGQAGVRVAIDDFGTGFSNLSLLARLPLDELKIDRSLVAQIGSNPKSEAIIGAIVGMTRALGCQVIAEGIETPQQLAVLQRLGCDMVQGYLLGRPVAPDQLSAPAPGPAPAATLPPPTVTQGRRMTPPQPQQLQPTTA